MDLRKLRIWICHHHMWLAVYQSDSMLHSRLSPGDLDTIRHQTYMNLNQRFFACRHHRYTNLLKWQQL